MNAQEHATTGYSPPQKLRRSSRPAEQAQQQVDDLADQYRSAALEIINLPEYLQQAKGIKSAVHHQLVHLPAGATQAQQTFGWSSRSFVVWLPRAASRPRPPQPLCATLTAPARRLQPRAWVSQGRC